MEYKVNNKANCHGTSFFGMTFETSFNELEKLLGEPNPGDDYKVTSQWILEGEHGEVATIYDWKQTDLYDPKLPSVKKFRQSSYAEWNLGGCTQELTESLYLWLYKKLKKRTWG